jgi:hypothetical protein
LRIADVSHGRDGRVTFTRSGNTLDFRDGRGGQTHGAEELMEIRHFLPRAGAMTVAAVALGSHFMVFAKRLPGRFAEQVVIAISSALGARAEP